MKVCIHRGTQQIGGTCIEIEAEGRRLVLDLGLPLDAEDFDDMESLLPDVPGFKEPDDSLLGVLISHPHQDHYGLTRYIRPEVPVLIGEKAKRILAAASLFTPSGVVFNETITLIDREPLTLGPFTITPYLVDHSAYDAYALLVEAGGKRLFYSGDFRGHGRKRALFDWLLREPPPEIDVLLMEGTTLGREDHGPTIPAESELEDMFLERFRDTEGMALVMASAQNIDRMVTVFRACKRSGRQLLIDLYAAEVLHATGNPNIPQSFWEGVRLFVPHYQRVHVKNEELFPTLVRHSSNRIFPERLAEEASKSVMLFRGGMRRDLERAGCLSGASLIYSLWEGYLAEDSARPWREWLERHGIPMTIIHTSGHASPVDLRRFAAAIAPRMLVPIHSFHTDRFPELFDNVERKTDGEWWGV